MAKIAIVTDSNSGITQEEAKALGIYVVPMPVLINGEEYFEDVNLTLDQFYEKMEADQDFSTSMPSPGSIMDLWDEILEEYDEIVHIPMSSALSGSCAAAMGFAMEDQYEGKVHVVDNLRISVTLMQSALKAKKLVEEGKSAAEIKKILEAEKLKFSIILSIDTLKYLKKGGRITPGAAALGTLLRIKPVLHVQEDKLDKYATARTAKQARGIIMDYARNDFKTKYDYPEGKNLDLYVIYSRDLEPAGEFRNQLLEEFPGREIPIKPLTMSIATHTGPGAICLAIAEKV
jgi:DegV family protein with EDD domain